jgi:hypothetical protein
MSEQPLVGTLFQILLVALMLTGPGCLDHSGNASPTSSTTGTDGPSNGHPCPSLLSDLSKQTCRHPLTADVRLADCTHPDNDFPVPAALVPTQPFTMRDSNPVYIQMHIVSCTSGTIDNVSLGAVSYAIVGPYINSPAGAPDAFSTAYAAECLTNNAKLQAWLSMVNITCQTGTITVSNSGGVMSATVQGAGTYTSQPRTYVPASSNNFEINQAFGAPGGGRVLTEAFTGTQLGMASPGTTTVMGGYLGNMTQGNGVLSGFTSPGAGAAIGLKAAAI